MNKTRSGLLAATVLAAALVAGCGGGGDSGPTEDISSSTSDLLAYINRLIAGTDETSEPIDINSLTLAQDDTGEPAAF